MKPGERVIQQLIVIADAAGPRVVGRSDAVPFAIEEQALQTAVKFGRRIPGVPCPSAIFALPFPDGFVAVVHAADDPAAAGEAPPLLFRLLILTRVLYRELGDPFLIDDRFPVDWSRRGMLTTLEWPAEPLPHRTVAEIAAILHDDGPLLLGAAQAIIDGSRVLIQRVGPTEEIRKLWRLLPTRTQSELWPASFAFSNELGFHVVAMPVLPQPLPPGTSGEEQLRMYPDGRYELRLQIAAENNDQAALNQLLSRPSSQDTLRQALIMLGLTLVAVVLGKWLFGG